MSSLDSKTLFASFAVMAIVAAAFAGISILGDDSEASTSTYNVAVGDTWSTFRIIPGETVTGSIPGITLTSQFMGGMYFILGSGTFTTAGTYELSSDQGYSAQVVVSASGGSSSGSDSSSSSGSSSTSDSSTISAVVGETWSSKQFMPGSIIKSGSVPGISFSSKILAGASFIMASGTLTTAGTYTVVSDYPWTVILTVTESGSSDEKINFTSPAAVDSVSGSAIKYQATTNISGTTFSVTGSGNASWLTLTSAGLLSGTAPTVSSMTSYTYSIKATSLGGQSATQKVTFDVYPVAQLKATSTSISGSVGSAITAVTVSSNLDCSLSLQDSSKLTALGLSWNASAGTISGTPIKAGSATIKVLGATTVGPSQSPLIEISISVGEAALKITSEPPTGTFVPGKQYTYNLSANQDVTWSISGNPSWLALSGSKVSGQVKSDSTSVSTVSYSVTAKTSGGQSATQQVTITVEPTIEFTSVPTASCSVTPVYTYKADGSFSILGFFGLSFIECDAATPVLGSQVMTTGGDLDDLDYTAPDAVSAITGSKFTYNPSTNITGTEFSKVSGADWLTLSEGIVSGTAPSVTEKTDYQIVIRATSPYNQTIDQTVTITVYPIVKLTASALSTSVHQNSEMNEISVTSNVSVTWSKSGDLPSGVTFSNGVLSGTPTVQGSFPVTVYGASIEGPSQTASIKVTIIVGEPVLEITSDFPTSMFLVGKQYSYTVETNVPNCTFALDSDKPVWAVITDAAISGQITGYTDGTTIEFTVTATSPENQVASQKVSVVIEPVIVFTTVPTASCIVLAEYTYNDDGSFVLKNVLMMPLAVASMALCSVPAVLDVQALEAVSASIEPVSTPTLGADMILGDDAGGSSSAVSAPDVTETGTRTFKFVWTGEDAERVTWDFGDGTTGEGFQITHTYDKNGTYTYTCTGINSIGSSSVSGKVTVNVEDGGINSIVLIGIGILLLIVIAAIVHHSKKRNAGYSGRRR